MRNVSRWGQLERHEVTGGKRRRDRIECVCVWEGVCIAHITLHWFGPFGGLNMNPIIRSCLSTRFLSNWLSRIDQAVDVSQSRSCANATENESDPPPPNTPIPSETHDTHTYMHAWTVRFTDIHAPCRNKAVIEVSLLDEAVMPMLQRLTGLANQIIKSIPYVELVKRNKPKVKI